MIELNKHCIQESRISRIETRLDKKHDEIEEIRDELQYDREQIKEILITLTQLTATLKTLQWIMILLATLAGSGMITIIIKGG